MTKIISATEMRDRLLKKLELNATYGKMDWAKVKYHPTPIRFEKCENDYGWMTEVEMRQYDEIREWCIANFDIDDWYSGFYYVWLKHERMVTWFTLRWS